MRVLVVDDNDLVRAAVVKLVSMLGADVEAASNGKDALDVFRTSQPDLLITDLNMPVIDGVSLIRLVRQGEPPIPVVLITGEPEAVPNEVFLLDRVLVLRKPVSGGQLIAAIFHDWKHIPA